MDERTKARNRLTQASRENRLAREAMLALFEAHRAGRFASIGHPGEDPFSASRDEVGILASYLFWGARDELQAATAAMAEQEARINGGD